MTATRTATGIATLPMYDWPEVQPVQDALWGAVAAALAAQGITAPPSLTRGVDFQAAWLDEGLLLSQTCGYPFATRLRGRVKLVATPCYAVPGCTGASYSSAIIVHRSHPAATLEDLATARFGTVAVNALDSQSGYWGLRAAFAGAGALPPERVVLTGGHRPSLRAVARGEADVAGIDAICWALALRHEPDAAAELRVIGFTPSAPGLPFISGAATPTATIACLRKVLAAAALGPGGSEFRNHLFLTTAQVLPVTDYDRILRLAAVARQTPWPEPAG